MCHFCYFPKLYYYNKDNNNNSLEISVRREGWVSYNHNCNLVHSCYWSTLTYMRIAPSCRGASLPIKTKKKRTASFVFRISKMLWMPADYLWSYTSPSLQFHERKSDNSFNHFTIKSASLSVYLFVCKTSYMSGVVGIFICSQSVSKLASCFCYILCLDQSWHSLILMFRLTLCCGIRILV